MNITKHLYHFLLIFFFKGGEILCIYQKKHVYYKYVYLQKKL
jgi:hypothetical protein